MKTQVVNRTLSKALLTTVSAISLFATAFAVQAKDEDFSRAQKEIRIMSKIFETSLEEVSTKRIRGSRSVDATYLAKQGMVFTFNFGRGTFGEANWEAFGEGVGEMVGAIVSEVSGALAEAPLAPEAPIAVVPDVDWAADYEERWEAYQERMEALEALREQHREQREEVRELQREIRSLERKSVREEAKSKELEKVKQKLEEKVKSLNAKMAEYKKSMADYRKKRDQKYIENTKTKSDAIISTLCDYGATMRSLKSGEHITLIFTNYQDNKDQIYVFNSTDVKRCENHDKLMKRAISYQL